MDKVILISNGDFRDTAAVNCWPMQEETLCQVERAFGSLEVKTERGNPFKTNLNHGFITTQAEGCEVFAKIDPELPVAIVLSSWVYAHHVASSLKLHQGPILLIGNFDGTWPGLVALLNHSATFDRMAIPHSKIWSDGFSSDRNFMTRLSQWVDKGSIAYPIDHIAPLRSLKISEEAESFGHELAQDILKRKRILGQMDPGCMGMLNAVMSPDKLARVGLPLELLNQSDLLAEMSLVTDDEAEQTLDWLINKKVEFKWGTDDETELTRNQVLEQMKMYIAAGRIHERYGLSAIGIPYQYGLVRCTSASDLAEGMLNNRERPEIISSSTGSPIAQDRPIVHFNEGDVGSGVPQVLMHDILVKKRMPPETTLHDVRWGDEWEGKFVWALEISGGAPPAHFGGWDKTTVYRQTPMYFPKGGGTCSGISKPGKVTWARFYESFGQIGMDMGTGEVLDLPEDEVKRRLSCTSEEWPIANLYIPGYDRDKLMSTHKSNHITICYGNILQELASTAQKIGIEVSIIGDAVNEFNS
jgi:L-fucose isomerase-like protein